MIGLENAYENTYKNADFAPSKQHYMSDYALIEKALVYLEDHYLDQPSLDEIAEHIGLSEFHFQRLFTRWVGISPKRFLQFLTREHAKMLLDREVSVMDTAFLTGLSSPGRLHDLFVKLDAVTPGEYKQRGAGLSIYYGFHPTPFGECMLALTERGLCGMSFVSRGDRDGTLMDLRRRWNSAELIQDPQQTELILDQVFFGGSQKGEPLTIYLQGTNFQIKVWEALLRIQPGSLTTYERIAAQIGRPTAARAVGLAVGSNPISYLIPCHRVIRKMGVFGGYRWGAARKKAILGWELSGAPAVFAQEVAV